MGLARNLPPVRPVPDRFMGDACRPIGSMGGRGSTVVLRALSGMLVALALAVLPGPVTANPANAEYRVVLDAGHGGRDGGATGRLGTREKDVTLKFARLVAERLSGEPGIAVLMTRDGDEAVRLDDRVTFGRESAADLFISVHADTIRHRGVRGASVYTLADEASDEVAASLAEGQARSDLLAGFEAPVKSEPVADILLDLMRRETEAFSHAFAERAVRSLGKHTRMIRNPHRYGDFRVLRAPDVPSVLIELGYLSNRRDERLLRDEAWLRSTADVLASAIAAHARAQGVGSVGEGG